MIIFLIQNPLFSGGIANFSFGPEHLSFLHSLHLLLKRKSENKIRNGKLLKHKLSISEGGISLWKFVPGIFSLTLGGNTNLAYWDVENVLSAPSVVEMTKSDW